MTPRDPRGHYLHRHLSRMGQAGKKEEEEEEEEEDGGGRGGQGDICLPDTRFHLNITFCGQVLSTGGTG